MPLVTTSVEIAASPAEVRKTFMDFDNYPEWAKAHLRGVQVTSGDKDDIKAGDTLKVTLAGATFSPTVLANTPEEFSWHGSVPYIFTGDHVYRFKPSVVTPGHTTVIQEENFTGLLSYLVTPDWSMGKQTKAGFEGFNQKLKARAEGSQS